MRSSAIWASTSASPAAQGRTCRTTAPNQGLPARPPPTPRQASSRNSRSATPTQPLRLLPGLTKRGSLVAPDRTERDHRAVTRAAVESKCPAGMEATAPPTGGDLPPDSRDPTSPPTRYALGSDVTDPTLAGVEGGAAASLGGRGGRDDQRDQERQGDSRGKSHASMVLRPRGRTHSDPRVRWAPRVGGRRSNPRPHPATHASAQAPADHPLSHPLDRLTSWQFGDRGGFGHSEALNSPSSALKASKIAAARSRASLITGSMMISSGLLELSMLTRRTPRASKSSSIFEP